MTRKPPSLTPRPVRDILPDALAELLRDQPLSQARLEFAWRAAAGPALTRVTAIALDRDTLRVEVAGPLWALEVERAAPQLVGRLARLLGPGVVSALAVRSSGSEPGPPCRRRQPYPRRRRA